MTDLWRKLKGSWRRRALNEELREEIQTHLDMKTADVGNRRSARQAFGHPDLVLEDAQNVWRWSALEALRQDVQYSLRVMRRSPGFTLVVVLCLGIGIGGNTAIFSLIDKVLLKKLPVSRPEKLVVVSANTGRGINRLFTYPDFADYRGQNQVFEELVGYTQRPLTLNEGGQAERIQGTIVSGNYFSALGVGLALGRGFVPEEDQTRGTHPVVVLSYGFWQRRFSADPRLVGQTVNLNGYQFTVIGITPAEFTGTVPGIAPDAYVPVMMQGPVTPSWKIDPLFGPLSRDRAWLELFGRLRAGVTREQATAAMTILGSQIARANPASKGAARPEPRFLLEDGSRGNTLLLRDLELPSLLLMATVGLILLIACANVANLLLVRAGARQKEIAVRLAIGAGRGRLIRQMLTESVLLSLLGAGAGLALAASVSGLVIRYTPPNSFMSLTLENRLDARVLVFTLAISLLTGIVFGLAPALSASRPNLVPALKDKRGLLGRGGRRGLTLGHVLVVGQVALSLIVLVGAGLCVRSLQKLQSIDAGFDTARVLLLSADVSLSGYETERGLRFYTDLVERVKRLRGVEAASIAVQVPLAGNINSTLRGEGYAPQPGEDLSSDFNIVGPDYFRTMKIPLQQGREFGEADTTTTLPVAIVNETTARRFWADRSPIGRRVILGRAPNEEVREIVGVVKDSKYRQLNEVVRPTVYVPFSQDYRASMALHVRTTDDPAAMLAAVRREVQALDPTLPIYDIKTLEEQRSNSLFTSRMAATLLTLFGVLALLLAAIGLYGVMAYAASRRTHEIGIRIALGAQAREVRRPLMREGAAVLALGLALGLGGALAATRLVETFLYGVTPTDPIAVAGAVALLGGVALVANYLPARQASRTDPILAIRQSEPTM